MFKLRFNTSVYFLSALISISIISCISQKSGSITSESIVFKSISFGNGGGFTGQYDHYKLKKDGSLLKINEKDSILINTLVYDEIEIINNNIKSLDDTYSINEPGNYTYYLDIEKGDKVIKQVWSTEVDQNLNDLYKLLMSYTKPNR